MHNSKNTLGAFALILACVALPAYADSEEIVTTTKVNLKYQQRIKDLGEQIRMLDDKGFLTKEETATFLDRQAQLGKTEESVRTKGFQKPATDELEKAVTQLNGDVFKASHKSNPIKPGQAEKEVNDPNLIPAYSDPNLQPGSGNVDKMN